MTTASKTFSSKFLSRYDFLLKKYVNFEINYGSEEILSQLDSGRLVCKIDWMITKLTYNDFLQIINADPTTCFNGEIFSDLKNIKENYNDPKKNLLEKKHIKVGEYSEWLIKHFLKIDNKGKFSVLTFNKENLILRVRYIEDLYKVNESLRKFHRFKSRLSVNLRDINKLNLLELDKLVEQYSLVKTKANVHEKIAARNSYVYPGSEIIFKGLLWTVVKISELTELGKDAACFFGGYDLKPAMGETKWCTSSPGSHNRYMYHANKGPLYVILPNNCKELGKKTGLPASRYQFHIKTNQFKDENDLDIDLLNFLNGPMKELKDIFKIEFSIGLTSHHEQELVIDDFNNDFVIKFFKLFNFADLIDSLPLTLTKIYVKNNSMSSFIDIPPTISRLENLTSLYFKNCIKKVPEETSMLRKLIFISFEKNRLLPTIPESLIDLPKLLFLNLKDCDGLKLSDNFINNRIEFMKDMWKGNAMI